MSATKQAEIPDVDVRSTYHMTALDLVICCVLECISITGLASTGTPTEHQSVPFGVWNNHPSRDDRIRSGVKPAATNEA